MLPVDIFFLTKRPVFPFALSSKNYAASPSLGNGDVGQCARAPVGLVG